MARNLSRRNLLRQAGAAVGGLAASDLLAACALPAPPDAAATRASVGAAAPRHADVSSTRAPLLAFPQGFRWGVATSAYQIEGAVRADGRGASIWDRFSHTPGKTKYGATGDVACDHYHRWADDLDLMQRLGVPSYRFSIAWPRVLPNGLGQVNQKGLDFYRRLAEGLLQRNIRPMATLYHWDLPQTLQDRGGWPARDTAQRFASYAEVVFRALGDVVPDWITLNEPWVVANVGYRWGGHAPGVTDAMAAARARQHLLLAHGLAVQSFRATRPARGQIGITLNLSPVYPATATVEDRMAALLTDGFLNRAYLDPVLRGSDPTDVQVSGESTNSAYDRIPAADLPTIHAPIDFLGVNYYAPSYVTGPLTAIRTLSGHHATTAMGWEIVPSGLYDLLVRITHDYGRVPLYVTENGAAFGDRVGRDGQIDDGERVRFLHDHIAAAHQALQAGVPLHGYYAWALMDNFEWAEGYTKRFGLVYVDYATQRRIAKRSALWYRDVIRYNGVSA